MATLAIDAISSSVRQTEAIAADLARQLVPGDCIALGGYLGAGKTQFVRGLVAGLGGDTHEVSSPTFVLLHIYDTRSLRVFHLDAYRTHGSDDFDGIGFAELLEQGGVVVVEWPERVESLLPGRRIEVKITTLSPRRRRIQISRC
jgi:tRNA threonylcarbamoyladenosine biosynthesis protein TsaE